MLDDEIKKQARDVARYGEMLETGEPEETIEEISIPIEVLDNMPDDARAWRDAAMDKELDRREGALEENERKYEASMVNVYADKDGNTEEKITVAYERWVDGKLYVNMTAFGYDRLPSDVQEMYGAREDVIENWIVETEEMQLAYKAYVHYAYKDNEGFDSWEKYRDAKLGKTEEISIESAQDVDNNKPRETPAVDQDTQNLITK